MATSGVKAPCRLVARCVKGASKKRRQLAPAVDVSTTAFGERAPPMDGKCERLDWIEPATGPRLALRLAMAEAV
jgi:hypothetical protein